MPPTRTGGGAAAQGAEDALVLDTGELDVDGCVDAIVAAPARPADEHARQADAAPGSSTPAPIDHRLAAWLSWAAPASRGSSTSRAAAPTSWSRNHCSNLDPPIIGWAVGRRTAGSSTSWPRRRCAAGRSIGWLARGIRRLLRAPRRGRPRGAADRARPPGRRAADRRLSGGDALPRREPARGEGRRRAAGHAHAACRSCRSGSPAAQRIFPGRSAVAASHPHRHPHRRSRSGCRTSPIGRLDRDALDRGHGADHAGDRRAPARVAAGRWGNRPPGVSLR